MSPRTITRCLTDNVGAAMILKRPESALHPRVAALVERGSGPDHDLLDRIARLPAEEQEYLAMLMEREFHSDPGLLSDGARREEYWRLHVSGSEATACSDQSERRVAAPTGNGDRGEALLLVPASPIPRVFLVDGQQIALADEALQALADESEPSTYVRAQLLVRVVRDRGRRARGIKIPNGAITIEPVSLHALRDRLARIGPWIRHTHNGQIDILPPEWLIKNLLAREFWPFPILEGVIEAPTMRPDGSVLDRPGFDESTGLLHIPSCTFPPVPECPTDADVKRAVTALLDPLCDFPFRAESDRSAALAATLSLVARHAIEGCVPLFPIRAPSPGTGKGLLADVVAIVGTGRAAARMSPSSGDSEMRKRILAIAIEGLPIVLIDNADGPLGSRSLAAALTATMWKDRLLGVSAMVEAPLRLVWMATGNNIRFRGDLARRVVPIDMDAKHEHPEDRPAESFRHPDLLAQVQRNRPQLVIAALTVLRAFHLAGRPAQPEPSRMGSYESWDALVRRACIWAGLPDPLGGRERIRQEDDADIAAIGTALAACAETFGLEAFTAAGAAHAAETCSDLHDALLELIPGREKLDGRSVGNALRNVRGRIVDGMWFETSGKEHKTTLWRVERV